MMRNLTILFALFAIACATTGQRSEAPRVRMGCETLEFDATTGHLNGLSPDVSQARVGEVLPCSTGATKDGSTFNYGGGVFFVKHDFFFYTGKDFIEIRAKFKGTVSNGLLGAQPAAFEKLFGAPTQSAKLRGTLLYSTDYGCLRARFGGGGATHIAAHRQTCDEVAGWYQG